MRIYQPDRELLQAFIAENAKQCTGTLLDIGGQDGKRYRELFLNIDKYINLDIDPSYNPDIIASADNIPLENESIDCILCSEVVMYIFDIQQAISEMARVLKKGGTILLTSSFMATPAKHDHYCWQPGPNGWLKLMEPYFTDIQIEPRGHYHNQMGQNRRRFMILKWKLYERPVLGRLYSLWSHWTGVLTKFRDHHDRSEANQMFTMGFNVSARKK